MNPTELNTLLRPYIQRQQARKDREREFLIASALVLALLTAAFSLTFAFALNH